MTENEISKIVVDSALKVQRNLGFGLPESTYQASLTYEFEKKDFFKESEIGLPLEYDKVKLEYGYRIDLWLEREVIVDIKSVEDLNNVLMAQILTYLKLSENWLRFLINFNVLQIKN